MRIYNSLTKHTEAFRPIDDRKVIMYVCGITPYDQAHIGHARTYVFFDVLKRFLVKRDYHVYHIQNITDVDDKIIKRCKESGADPMALTTRNHDEALELLSKLHVLKADAYPKVTENIPQIISLIQTLVQRGKAYETKTGVYFDISSFPSYGALSHQDLEAIKAGSRFEVDESKDDAADFALWKKTQGEILEFDSPFGRGRPGWHIECSAMAGRYAGRTLDLHGAGRDLIFPHHENEIAQSEAATGEKFCNCWVHTGFLTVEGEKMSKSLGNFITLADALGRHRPNSIRFFFLQTHYRSPLDYSEDGIDSSDEGVERIFNSLGLIRESLAAKEGQHARHTATGHRDPEFRKESDQLIAAFYTHMDEDLNTPEAIASLFQLLRLTNAHLGLDKMDREQLEKIQIAIEEMLWIIGLQEERPALEGKLEALKTLLDELGVPGASASDNAEKAIELIISLREDARKKKDYARSDMIRARLKELGVVLEDKAGVSGQRWKII